jgi:hypothetical protein
LAFIDIGIRSLLSEKAELSAEAAALRAWVDAVDRVNAAPATPGNPTLDELQGEGA